MDTTSPAKNILVINLFVVKPDCKGMNMSLIVYNMRNTISKNGQNQTLTTVKLLGSAYIYLVYNFEWTMFRNVFFVSGAQWTIFVCLAERKAGYT